MNADQVIEGIGKAVAAVNSTPEYCLLGVDWWLVCLTKSEWSGWFQAIGSVVAIFVAILVPYLQHRHYRNVQVAEAVLHAITMSERLAKLSGVLKGLQESSECCMLKIPQFFDLPTAFRTLPLVEFPDLATQTGLTPVGMDYFRKASAAASELEKFKRAADECFETSHQYRDRALDLASCAARDAASACEDARKVLERFLAKNGVSG